MQRLLAVTCLLAPLLAPGATLDIYGVSTALSKSELLYAIETTFALNNLAITHVEEGTIGLGPNMEPGKDSGR